MCAGRGAATLAPLSLRVPHDQTSAALGEMRRILRPGGWLKFLARAA